MQLRPYQEECKMLSLDWWRKNPLDYLLTVLPTGAGKTVFFADMIATLNEYTCAIAHRQELVGQMSLTLGRNGIAHRIIAPPAVIKSIVRLHMEQLRKSFYNPDSKIAVAGVDTLIRRTEQLDKFSKLVKFIVVDEAHHVLKDNKWGSACKMFPNAKCLGVTATPTRADGHGLGSHSDGLFNHMLVGTDMAQLISQGYLTPYKIYAPPSDFHREDIPISESTGDFNQNKMREVVSNSSLVGKSVMGDIVKHYLRIAPGKLGVTFVSDLNTADEVCTQFNQAGVPAAVISSKMKDSERFKVLKSFERRELLQIVNVDILGEGFDCPAIEVISFGRPTESFSLYSQQFGRVLRILPGKSFGIIIDHVGNVMRHRGPPDLPRAWTLDARERRTGKSEPSLVRTCLNNECSASYERFRLVCPECGTPVPPSTERSTPGQVDGDLTELDPNVLAMLKAEAEKAMMDAGQYRDQLVAKGAPQIGVMRHVNNHIERKETLSELRDTMVNWLGRQITNGLSQSEQYRKFYLSFGIDWQSALSMKTKDAEQLITRINNSE